MKNQILESIRNKVLENGWTIVVQSEKDYSDEYFSFATNDGWMFYVQQNQFYGYDISGYKIVEFNEKQQYNYLEEEITDIEYVDKYIAETKSRRKPVIEHTQHITHDFIPYRKVGEPEYKDVFERVDMGFREKEIYNNKARFEQVQYDKNYNVYKIIDTNGDYFLIDVKNLKIVG